MTLDAVIDNIGNVNVLKIFFDVVEDHKDLLIKMNTKQLSQGIRADGRGITPSYAASTIKIKKSKGSGLGRQTSRVTLFMTGEYHGSFDIDIKGKTIDLGSQGSENADLAQHLINRYGEEIEGLTKENEKAFMIKITPEFIRRVENAFRGL